MSLATEPNVASIHGRIAAALAPDDERRSAYLELLVKKGGTCACGASVADALLLEHPGVCGTCTKRGVKPAPELLQQLADLGAPVRAPEPPPAVKYFTPPAPAPAEPATPTESKMPKNDPPKFCSIPGCGKKLRSDNSKGVCGPCQASGRKSVETKAAPAPSPARTSTPSTSKPAAPKRPARRARAVAGEDLDALDVQELLDLRSNLQRQIDDVRAELTSRAEKLEAQRKAVLDAIAAEAA